MAQRCVSPFVCETAKLEIFNIPIFLSLSCVLSDADVCFTLEGWVGRPGFIPLGLFLLRINLVLRFLRLFVSSRPAGETLR